MVTPPREVVECVPQKVHIATLPRRIGEHFPNSRFQPRVIVTDDELDPVQAALAQPAQELGRSVPALPLGQLDA
jgi:hypothetical protein